MRGAMPRERNMQSHFRKGAAFVRLPNCVPRGPRIACPPHDPHRHHHSRLRGHASTLPLGSADDENEVDETGERYTWLVPNVVDRLKAMRRPGESHSDVIIRLAEGDGGEE